MKIKVQNKHNEFYINPIYFSITKGVVKNGKRIDNFYLRFVKIYNKTDSLSLYCDLINKLAGKMYYEKYFKSPAIIFFRCNEEYLLPCKNEQERDEKFNQLINYKEQICKKY